MLLFHVVVATLLAAGPVAAQEPARSSSGDTGQSSTVDAQGGDLPVSLDRIRAGLKRQATDSLLKRTEIPPDFRIQILEQQ
jgi:hypothetical protein